MIRPTDIEPPAPDGVVNVDAATVRSWLNSGRAILVDVREPEEHAAERIPGSHLMPLSDFNPTRLPPEEGRRLILYCHTGCRSRQAGLWLLHSGRGMVGHLAGGIEAWKSAGHAVESAIPER